MNILYIIGWIFILASWIPKPFIKDIDTRLAINLILASIAVGIFIAGVIQFITK